MPDLLRIGTRGSTLARTQAAMVGAAIRERHPHLEVTLVTIETLGDRRRDVPLSALGSPGVFVKEIQRALQRDEIDVAVHSAKDLPSFQPDDLLLAAFPRREDPRDVVVLPQGREGPAAAALAEGASAGAVLGLLPPGSVVGTSAVRRRAVLARNFPHLKTEPIRGNLDTRLAKLASGEYDAIILAASGLKRLGLASLPFAYFDETEMIPAVAQGALAVEVRRDDHRAAAWVRSINHGATEKAVLAERAFLSVMGGTCAVPLGALAHVEGDQISMNAFAADPKGEPFLTVRGSGPAAQPEQLGRTLGEELWAAGGRDILDAHMAGPGTN